MFIMYINLYVLLLCFSISLMLTSLIELGKAAPFPIFWEFM